MLSGPRSVRSDYRPFFREPCRLLLSAIPDDVSFHRAPCPATMMRTLFCLLFLLYTNPHRPLSRHHGLTNTSASALGTQITTRLLP